LTFFEISRIVWIVRLFGQNAARAKDEFIAKLWTFVKI
jgi:hypothetical protein